MLAHQVRFGVLGPLVARIGDRELKLGGPKQRAALAVLLANANSPVTADTLIDTVYHDDTPGKPRQAVSQMMSTLRSILDGPLEPARNGWSITTPREDLDALQFDDLVEQANQDPDPLSRSRHLREALALWRGHPYADVEAHGYLEPERARLVETRLTALEALNDAELDQGHHRELVASLDALVVEHPYREAFRFQHMLALYRSDRQAEALRSFTALRETLVSELGIEPSQTVADLEQRILERDEGLLLPEAPLVRERVVLVADPGDPRDRPAAGSTNWLDTVETLHRMVTEAVEDGGGEIHSVAGTALFASFGSAVDALAGVKRALTRTKDVRGHIRAVLDAGDVEISDGIILGPPVVRAGRLLASAHTDQVLLASAAHEALSGSGESGWTASSLGSVSLPGVDGDLAVYQLQMPSLPQEARPVREELSPIRLPSARTIGLAGYEIRDRIGDGAVGDLHLGFHPSSGREVWLEVIAPEVAGAPGFISRFEAVMQRLSRLDHPNLIVPIDYWRDTDGAYLVYPRHRGSTLGAFTDENLSPEALTVVVSALDHAHSWGVVHGSLGMSRIHIGEEGHLYLFGFSSGLNEGSGQSPRYRAPEVVLEGSLSIEADLYAMGVLAFEWLTGGEAPMDVGIPATGLGSAVDAAIAKTTSSDPRERISGLEALRSQISDTKALSPTRRELRNPYKGLLAFQEADADDFYGRDQAIEELTEAARTRPLVAVVGPSGIGKSSLVKAGLVPQVRSGVLWDGEWLVTQMTPGPNPFEALRRALTRIAVLIPVSAEAQFAQSDPAVLDAVQRMLPVNAQALLIVDQFEELYTMTADPTERSSFLEFLQAASGPGSPLRVVLTLRADYLDHPLVDPEHGDLVRHGLVSVRAPNRDELIEAIVRPAESVGVEVEADLAERLAGEVVGEPGALPLTQLLLTGLFDDRESDRLTVADYQQAGGVLGSMADKAENIYRQLDPADQEITRQAFLRLMVVSEDSADTRSRTRLSTLPPGSQRILESFAAARLVVFDHDPVTRETTVEVAHEALIGGWPRLAAWVESLRDDLLLHRRFKESMADWQERGEEDAYLLSARQLAQHENWIPDSEIQLTASEREFLEESRVWVDAQETRRRRRRGWVLTGFAAAALIASVLGIAALINAGEARAQRTTAEANALAGFSGAVLDEDPELALLLALESVETEPGQTGIEALQDALQRHRHRQVLRVPDTVAIDPNFPLGGAMSPNGQWVASVDDGQTVKLWAVNGLDQPVQVIDYTETTGRFANFLWFDKGNASILVSTIDPAIEGMSPILDFRIYSVPDGELLQTISPPPLPCYRGGPPSQGSTPHMDLTRPLLFVTTDPADDGTCPQFAPGTIWSYDLFTEETESLWPGHPAATRPTVSDDWTRLAAPQFDRGAVVDLIAGEEILELPPGIADISGDGTIVLTGVPGGPAQAISIDDRAPISTFPASDFLFFGATGDIVYGAFPGSVRIFDVSTGDLLYEVERSPQPVPILSDDGNILFSGGDESTMRTSDVSSHMIGHTGTRAMRPERGEFLSRGMGTAGDLVVSVARPVDGDRATHLYDQTSGDLVLSLDGIGRALSPDGRLLAIQTRSEIVELDADESGGQPGDYYVFGPLVIVDVSTGAVVRKLDGLCTWFNSPANEILSPECSEEFPEPWQDWVDDVEFSPDGSLLAVGGRSGYVAVWDTSTGEMVWTLDTPQGVTQWVDDGYPTVAFSPDGSVLVVTQGTLRFGPERMLVVDTATWEVVAEPDLPDQILDTEFAPDGSYLAAGAAVTESLFVYDTETWELSDLGPQGDWIFSTSVSPDSSRVATVTNNGQIWIWDVASGSVVQKLSFAAPPDLWKAVFLDNNTLLVKSAEEIVTLFLDVDRLIDVARSRLTRSFTADECATYDIDPCPTLAEIRVSS